MKFTKKQTGETSTSKQISRRGMLKSMGVGAVAVGAVAATPAFGENSEGESTMSDAFQEFFQKRGVLLDDLLLQADGVRADHHRALVFEREVDGWNEIGKGLAHARGRFDADLGSRLKMRRRLLRHPQLLRTLLVGATSKFSRALQRAFRAEKGIGLPDHIRVPVGVGGRFKTKSII